MSRPGVKHQARRAAKSAGSYVARIARRDDAGFADYLGLTLSGITLAVVIWAVLAS